MYEVFYRVLNMSISATLIGGVVFLLRLIKQIPRRFSILLWCAPFSRFVIPVGIGSYLSIINLLGTRTVTVLLPVGDKLTMMNFTGLASNYFPVKYELNILEDVFRIAGIAWAIGAGLIAAFFLIGYITAGHNVKNAEHHCDNIYFSDKVESPAVYGIFKPRIILPPSYKSTELDFVLLHERSHIKRLDNLWRLLAVFTAAFHWFNPFAWLFLRLFLTDIELACDERVLMSVDSKEYAEFLLERKAGRMMLVSAFGGASISARIKNILSFKKLSTVSIIAMASLIAAAFAVLLTNAK